jgi:LysM repeat protein
MSDRREDGFRPEDDPEATQAQGPGARGDETTGQFATVAAETRYMDARQSLLGPRAADGADPSLEPLSVKPKRLPTGGFNLPRLIAPAVFLVAVIAVLAIAVNSGVVGGKKTGVPATTGNGTTHPSAKASSSPKPKKFYVVRSGDTLSAIAAKHHTTVVELQTLNPSLTSTTLRVGQKIKLPQPQ